MAAGRKTSVSQKNNNEWLSNITAMLQILINFRFGSQHMVLKLHSYSSVDVKKITDVAGTWFAFKIELCLTWSKASKRLIKPGIRTIWQWTGRFSLKKNSPTTGPWQNISTNFYQSSEGKLLDTETFFVDGSIIIIIQSSLSILSTRQNFVISMPGISEG